MLLQFAPVEVQAGGRVVGHPPRAEQDQDAPRVEDREEDGQAHAGFEHDIGPIQPPRLEVAFIEVEAGQDDQDDRAQSLLDHGPQPAALQALGVAAQGLHRHRRNLQALLLPDRLEVRGPGRIVAHGAPPCWKRRDRMDFRRWILTATAPGERPVISLMAAASRSSR